MKKGYYNGIPNVKNIIPAFIFSTFIEEMFIKIVAKTLGLHHANPTTNVNNAAKNNAKKLISIKLGLKIRESILIN